MRKIILFSIAFVGISVSQVNAQFTFSVSPGLSFNNANFGYKIGDRLVPFVGLQYFNGSFDYVETGKEYDPETGSIEDYEREMNGSASLLIPTIGAKYFAFEHNDLKGYFQASISKPLLMGRGEQDGQEVEDLEDFIDEISFWGGEVGFGTEYFFSEVFSVGGEFGIRWIRINQESSYQNMVFDPNTGTPIESEVETDLGINFNPTYAKISLNFYFD